MADVDQILEAEQSIQQIASELSRMRDAATLLQESLTNSESVITASKELIETTERFSEGCGRVVNMLAQTDLGQKLESLQQIHGEVEDVKYSINRTLHEMSSRIQNDALTATSELKEALKIISDISNSNSELLKANIEEQTQLFSAEFGKLADQIKRINTDHKKIAEAAKTRSTALLVLLIFIFIASFAPYLLPLLNQVN